MQATFWCQHSLIVKGNVGLIWVGVGKGKVGVSELLLNPVPYPLCVCLYKRMENANEHVQFKWKISVMSALRVRVYVRTLQNIHIHGEDA